MANLSVTDIAPDETGKVYVTLSGDDGSTFKFAGSESVALELARAALDWRANRDRYRTRLRALRSRYDVARWIACLEKSERAARELRASRERYREQVRRLFRAAHGLSV